MSRCCAGCSKMLCRASIEILPQIIERQDYAFGLKPGFAQRQALNRARLAQIRGTEWQETLNRYLGQRWWERGTYHVFRQDW